MLKTITQLTALGGLALTAFGFFIDEFSAFQSFVLIVFFAWAYIYAAEQIEI
jgi:hypothetical protein